MDAPLRRKEIEAFFSCQADRIMLYDALEKMIKSLGPSTITISKTQIFFGTKYKFAWVWLPPDKSNRRPKNCIVLTFGLNHRIENEQIVEAVEPYPERWTHHIIIANRSDLNENVFEWLRQAYAFSGKR